MVPTVSLISFLYIFIARSQALEGLFIFHLPHCHAQGAEQVLGNHALHFYKELPPPPGWQKHEKVTLWRTQSQAAVAKKHKSSSLAGTKFYKVKIGDVYTKCTLKWKKKLLKFDNKVS